jgi:chemotaxis protein methyltransferase CheR
MSTMTSAQFDQFCTLVYGESAIVLEPGKEYLVESRLAPIARREGLASVGALLQRLASSPTTALRGAMLDAMTTNETSFFRDVHPWHALKTEILPQLIEARRSSKALTIWSAACSSGQEPYSLAMLIMDEFPDVARTWDIRIISTDISPSMVARCRQGLFSQLEVNRGLPAAMLPRFFTRDGMQFRIDPAASRMLDVRLGNLLASGCAARQPRSGDDPQRADLLRRRDQEQDRRGDSKSSAPRWRPDARLVRDRGRQRRGVHQGAKRQDRLLPPAVIMNPMTSACNPGRFSVCVECWKEPEWPRANMRS